jgi:iron complex outermembrane receptor protein
MTLAQTAGSTPSNQAAAADKPDVASSLDAIVVTARKTAERSLDVPIAITSFSQEQMARYALDDLQLISRSTPGLVIGPTSGTSGAAISLRGIGGSPTAYSVEQPVSINLDGVQLSQGAAARLGLFDVDRIEVLKGPQALFFGKNSPAGVISIISADPTNKFEARLRGSYEVYGEKSRLEAMLSGPIADNLRARIDVYGSNENGWFRNTIKPTSAPGLVPPKLTGPNGKEISARATLIYTSPDDKFSAKLKAGVSHQNQKVGYDTLIQYIYCPLGRPAQTINLVGASTDCAVDRNYIQASAPAASLLSPLYRDGNPYARSTAYLASLAAQYEISDSLSLESTTGYYDNREARYAGSIVFNESALVSFAVDNGYTQLSQELRLRSQFDGPFNFVVGGYAEKSILNLYGMPLTVGPPAVPTYRINVNKRWKQDGRNFSVFAQINYKLLDNVTLEGGVRYSTETKSIVGFERAPSAPVVGKLSFPVTKSTYDNASPEVTLTYKPAESVNVYATYRTGFKSGGFNLGTSVANGTDISFRPETVHGAEVGLKALLIDKQLRINAAAYRYDYEDLQVGFFQPNALGTVIFNAAGARVQGIEVSGEFAPRSLAGVSVRGSVNYNDSKYTSYVAPCYVGQTPSQGCSLVKSGAAFTSQDLRGRALNRAPKWTGNVGATSSNELGGDMRIDISADATYSSSYMTDVGYAPEGLQKGFWRLDASVSVLDTSRWKLALIGRNLTNKLVVTNSNSAAFTGGGTGTAAGRRGDQVASIGQPRAIELELTLHY